MFSREPSTQAIGYGLVIITFSMQSLMKWACDRLTGWKRLVVADIFLTFSFIGTVNVWRGIWQLLDIYFLPGTKCRKAEGQRSKFPIIHSSHPIIIIIIADNKLLGDFISHAGSFLLLALLNCSNSVLVRGVYIDAEEPNGQCVIFPIFYIRLFFEKERSRKQQKHLESMLEKGEHTVFLSDKQTNNMTATVKNSTKSIEMAAMLNHKNSNATMDTEKNHIISQWIWTRMCSRMTFCTTTSINNNKNTSWPGLCVTLLIYTYHRLQWIVMIKCYCDW